MNRYIKNRNFLKSNFSELCEIIDGGIGDAKFMQRLYT